MQVKAEPQVYARSHSAMGTKFTVYLGRCDETQAQACFESVFDEIDRIEHTFSRFRASSEISRINREAHSGPMVTDPEVFQVLVSALDVSRKTKGVFDITVGQLTRAWGFPARQPKVPDVQTLLIAYENVGWNYIELDSQWRTVHFTRPGLELDLGAIAKGYAVDCGLESLRSVGITGIIDAGSSSIASTDSDFSQNWKLQIPNPMDTTVSLCEVELGRRALATSGVKEQSFVQNGRIFSHLIDPTSRDLQTSVPENQVLQVTVLAPNSMLADSLSTALFLLGSENGRTVLKQFEDCSALWVCSEANRVACYTHQWPVPSFSI